MHQTCLVLIPIALIPFICNEIFNCEKELVQQRQVIIIMSLSIMFSYCYKI